MKTFIFAPSQGKKEETALYNTTDGVWIQENNTKSLAKCYNKAIDFAIKENIDNLILVHDDVILENYSEEKVEALLQKFDIVGVAGTTQVKLQNPALWHIMGGGFGSGNLHGAVAHGDAKVKNMTSFGPYPKRVILLDGVFLAISSKVFKKIRFDESCPSKWHLYDLDYSMQCYKAGFKLGVGDILITHQSPGLSEVTEEFKRGSEWFLNKWKTK
tara:strand:+ start:571 stop:1215 length:645 start_codon:yes stop_codon:yes gene_type:complete